MGDEPRPAGAAPAGAAPAGTGHPGGRVGEHGSGPARTVRIAFFDVDETLVDIKSMFSFLEFHLADPDRYRAAENELTSAARAGVPREETNRTYYRNYTGMEQAAVAASGRRWFARELRREGFLHREAVRELRRLRAEGHRIALVSGSFRACLDPIAEQLGAEHVLCSDPEVVAGRYTGEVRAAMIGEAKATAARALMARSGARPEDCVAYGDHASDLPLLTCVGRAGIVGDDPVLAAHADRLGWTRLPRTAAPTATAAAPETAGPAAAVPASETAGPTAAKAATAAVPETAGPAATAQGSAAAGPATSAYATQPATPPGPSAPGTPAVPAAAPSTLIPASTEELTHATR
ncbi:HAD family hydrolase [Streptomyces sp. NPDC059766]|uniref:HAD family hydrolase n=1 Tax=Streptomyces sp. NPDC059766 TaxID=3346940 RepID=UPI0036469441